MKKLFAFLFFIFYFLFLLPLPLFASENFSVSSDVTYTVRENGTTQATFIISLTNTTSQYYASSYKIKLGFENIENITASDPDGPITPTVLKTEDGYSLDVPFNKRVVGIGETFVFNLTFDTTDIAQNQGRVWELNIPGLSFQNDFSNFNVHLKVPSSFGQPSYIKPQFTKNVSLDSLNFTKEQLQKGGISVAFGTSQIYGFKLSYRLKNKNVFPIRTEIALPLKTNYQDVIIDDISPKPIQVAQDRDGNWLAQYYLMPRELKEVVVKGKAQLFLRPKKQPQKESELARYLTEKPYWQISDEKIKKLANDLKTPTAIYEYVVKTLKYDFARVTDSKPRLGAAKVLANPNSAVCLEFTDLFVTLARAAGIPAREVDGFAYTENSKQRPLSLVKDILHAWPEYYDREQQTWIMVDPTWGNTTGGVDYLNILDFDHFAFVIKGEDSSYPVPAGGYKLPGKEESKDVEVFFSKEEILPIQNFEISDSIPRQILSALPLQATIALKNTGNSVLEPQTAEIESRMLSPKKRTLQFPEIPPFGFATLPTSFEKTPFLTNLTDTITIRVGGKTLRKNVRISPVVFSRFYFIIGGAIGAGILIIIISIVTTRSRRISVLEQKQASAVRGESEKS